MMFRKNKMLLNIVIDFVMLTAMALVSISGFILEIVIPSLMLSNFKVLPHGVHNYWALEGMIGAIFICGQELYWSFCLLFIFYYT